MFEDYKEIAVSIASVLTTVLILKADYIKSKFVKTEKQLEVAASKESVEAASLANVETQMSIYSGIIETLKSNINDLKIEIKELNDLVSEQKLFISQQSRSLQYYERKFGRIKED